MKSNTVMLCYRNRNGRELRERLVCNIIFPPCCEAWRQRTKTKHLLALVHHLIVYKREYTQPCFVIPQQCGFLEHRCAADLYMAHRYIVFSSSVHQK